MVGFAFFIVATLTLVVGDPFWNIYFIWFGWFIALPVAIIALVWRSVRRGHVLRSSG